MARLSPDQVAAQWATRLAQSGDRIAAGVNGVTVAPGTAAARQKTAYTQNVAASADKWARNVAAVPLGEWQTAMREKGVPRIAAGAQAAQPKFTQFMGKLLPYIDSQVAALPARGGLDQNLARMDKFARGMAKFQR